MAQIPEHYMQKILDELTTRRLTREETEEYKAALAKAKKKHTDEQQLQDEIMLAQRRMNIAERNAQEASRNHSKMLEAIKSARRSARPWGNWDADAIAAGETLIGRSRDTQTLAEQAVERAKVRLQDALAACEAGGND